MSMISMDRFTRLQKIFASSSIFTITIFVYILAEAKIPWYSILASIFLSVILYLALEYNPFTKIILNHNNKDILYYEFFVAPKLIPVSSVLDITGQTKIERSYGDGKSKTIYITDIFIFTRNQDYQVKVFERAKLQEFISKFNKAKSMIAL